MAKRTSGAAFLAERDKTVAAERDKTAITKEKEQAKKRSSLFVNLDIRDEVKVNFREVLSEVSAGGRMMAAAKSEAENTRLHPRCSWWKLQNGAGPLEGEDAGRGRLDLAKLGDKAAPAYVLVVEEQIIETLTKEHDCDRLQFREQDNIPWNVVLREPGAGKEPHVLLRLRRPAGVEKGYIWVAGILSRTPEGEWKTEAINEVYPAKRLPALLPLRCKDLFTAAEEKKPKKRELTPAEEAQKMMDEAMKEGY